VHKKPLPKYPGTIGIVTSSAGAAVHDMLRILRKRYPLSKVLLLPVRVQGAEAPGEIAAAIRYANYHRLADLLIVGRGGGSIEDLWAFNDEIVAHAIFDSQIPVISAVGHEPDVTISDYVADLRAATPSNAAELVVPDCDALLQAVDSMSAAMATALKRQIQTSRRHLDMLAQSNCLQSPEAYLRQRSDALQSMRNRLVAAQEKIVHFHRQRFISHAAKLDAMSPLKVISRGYSLAQTDNGALLRSVRQVQPGDCITISLSDGKIDAAVSQVKEIGYESE
jgi:exodeoxyribonuclease VII large subunit